MSARRPSAQHAPGYEHVRALLREMRDDAGLTQRQLGPLLGLDPSLIHRSEAGERRVTPIEFAQWAKACGVEPLDAMRNLLKRVQL